MLRRFLIAIALIALLGPGFAAIPRTWVRPADADLPPVVVAATTLPTGGITTASLFSPRPFIAITSVWVTNSNASAIWCNLFNTNAITLGTTVPVGASIEVPAGVTAFFPIPEQGLKASLFATAVGAGCATAFKGATGVALGTVDVGATGF